FEAVLSNNAAEKTVTDVLRELVGKKSVAVKPLSRIQGHDKLLGVVAVYKDGMAFRDFEDFENGLGYRQYHIL
ncbi:hypothetical protein HY485_03920, partial [Candidatus Woesearchaeota archaeon]|nr:hypothetical protein [Candidatus Woesearchaeota archaeon]